MVSQPWVALPLRLWKPMINIPFWALADDTPYPCPCGDPSEEEMIVFKGEKDKLRLYHPWCVQNYVDLDEVEDQYNEDD